jgi:ABC-type nitrate/sulfonate/bicarbonate transport system substrate-binding protein
MSRAGLIEMKTSKGNHRKRVLRMFLNKAVIAPLFCLSLIFAAHPSFAQTSLYIGTILRGTLGWPILVAMENSLFSQEGLATEVLELRRTSLVAQTLIAGSTPVAILGPDAAMMAIEKGANLSIVSTVLRTSTSVLVAQPRYRSVKELKKVKIGTGGPGGSTTQLEMILRQEGLRANEDYSLITLGSTRERFLALRAGGVDAALLSPTASFEAKESGLTLLAFVADYVKDYVQLASVVNNRTAADNPIVIRRYLKAMIKASRWLTDEKNKERAVGILLKYEKMPPQRGQRIYDFMIGKFGAISKNGEISPEGIKSVMVVTAPSGLIATPPQEYTKFINLKYLQLAHKELGIRN